MRYFVKRGEQVQGPLSREQLIGFVDARQLTETDQVGTSPQGPFQELKVAWPFIAGESNAHSPTVHPSTLQPPGVGSTDQKTGMKKTIVLACSIAGGILLIGIVAIILMTGGSGNSQADLPIEKAIEGEWEIEFQDGPKGRVVFRLMGDKIGMTRMGMGEVKNRIVEKKSQGNLGSVRDKFPKDAFAGWSESVSWIRLKEEELETEVLLVFDETRSTARIRASSPPESGMEFLEYGSMSLIKPSADTPARGEAEKEISSLLEAVRKEEKIQKGLIAVALKERKMLQNSDQVSVRAGDGNEQEISYGTKNFRPDPKADVPIVVTLPNEGVSAEVISKMKKSRDIVKKHIERIDELNQQYRFSDPY